ncbi:hypothetical protein CRG98_039105 [Punica granatum]|uniref:Uncharacterized protein n=1 Tax=Punica granatum TaxID=22663 RepID=A0A2I0I8Z7_PUNGR|nr:hypothetical protein CRG98_039105 [Punica granatum]
MPPRRRDRVEDVHDRENLRHLKQRLDQRDQRMEQRDQRMYPGGDGDPEFDEEEEIVTDFNINDSGLQGSSFHEGAFDDCWSAAQSTGIEGRSSGIPVRINGSVTDTRVVRCVTDQLEGAIRLSYIYESCSVTRGGSPAVVDLGCRTWGNVERSGLLIVVMDIIGGGRGTPSLPAGTGKE